MSEANSPENPPQPPNSNASSASSWYSDWDAFFNTSAIGREAQSPAPTEPSQTGQDWQTVNFPNAISADAIERQTMYNEPNPGETGTPDQWAARTIVPNAASANAWTENLAEPQPDVPQLISLIQELNQCNNALLDRVSQLEEVLELTQKTLKQERERSHLSNNAGTEELNTTRQQVATLFGELEMAHQTSQRQQMLVEALTEQLTLHQERVAQLERECVVSNQRCQEQAQLLAQREQSCQDLRIRLQRQQHYTLQFKAALERCLEVSATPPQAGLELLPTPATPPLVPKVRQIRPWSSQEGSGVPLKLDAMLSQPALVEATSSLAADNLNQVNPFAAAMEAIGPALTTGDEPAREDRGVGENSVELPPLDEETQTKLLQSLAKLVDLSAEEIVSAIQAEDASPSPDLSVPQTTASPTELPSLPSPSNHSPVTPLSLTGTAETADRSPSPTLRKLVSMPFEASMQKDRTVPGATSGATTAPGMAQADAPVPPNLGITGTNFPAPIVYPLRPQKKLASLAAVDLPTFPKA